MRNQSKQMALEWLESRAQETSFDGVNAGRVLDLLREKEERLTKLGVMFSNVRRQRDRAWAALEEAREGLTKPAPPPPPLDDATYWCSACHAYTKAKWITMYIGDRAVDGLVCTACYSEIETTEKAEKRPSGL